MNLFEPAKLGSLVLKNRLIRSATFEGSCDKNGFPGKGYLDQYLKLAKNPPGAIITGFAYISKAGRAMHPGQAGMDEEDKIEIFSKITKAVHQNNTKFFLQLAHTGRQTTKKATNTNVQGASSRKSFYFRGTPRKLTTSQAEQVINQFSQSAYYAKEADFDGIQLHAAHGYLLHQFILPSINSRNDKYGIDSEKNIGTAFLEEIIKKIRRTCGKNFSILVKISGSDDLRRPFNKKQFINLIHFLNNQEVDAIEISYGTMETALNIFRGDLPVDLILKTNPIHKIKNPITRQLWKILALPFLKRKHKPFTPHYNLYYARLAKKYTNIPIISVGGFRTGKEISAALETGQADFISLSRPFICEPDFVLKLHNNINYSSQCKNCNICAIMCDSGQSTRCYQKQ
jgi:2,4-dienoyl-CoA reductase-like NADH-dependent reductase (Old Yellow Enzyme family)